MVKEVTRHIKRETERELWARSAGRCQFDGCNKILYKSPLTQEQVNISEKAHIYSFSEDGPRGWGPFVVNKESINDLSNLMLVCHDCHLTIDKDKKGEKYSADLLVSWKESHEKRIAVVAGVNPTKKSHVVLYGANIGEQTSKLQPEAAKAALFPDWYPADENVIQLSMSWEGKDSDKKYWEIEAENLKRSFERQIKPVLATQDCHHLSVFSLAPMPLLILLGSLLTDKLPVEVYQLHREPYQTWHWLSSDKKTTFIAKPPKTLSCPPALVISLSDSILHSRVTDVLGDNISIWEFTIQNPHNDFMKTKEQLSKFREAMRKLIVDIGKEHGKATPIAIFPAMPVSCAVELGRIRMPKADSMWIIYDQNHVHNRFINALTIGVGHG